jgi:hypothetical protein
MSLWIFLSLLPTASQAALVRADYQLNFFPPSPCDVTSLGDLRDASLSGSLRFFSQNTRAGDLVEQNPGPPTIGALSCGASGGGVFEFELDLADGDQILYLSFDGDLVQTNPGPPTLPVYAFLPGDDVSSEPAAAPLLLLGLFGVDTNPGPPILPLFAFASPGHELGSLSVAFSVVPLPGSLLLLTSGLLLLRRLAGREKYGGP